MKIIDDKNLYTMQDIRTILIESGYKIKTISKLMNIVKYYKIKPVRKGTGATPFLYSEKDKKQIIDYYINKTKKKELEKEFEELKKRYRKKANELKREIKSLSHKKTK